jgi:heme-degrading monooxygenase HmoA
MSTSTVGGKPVAIAVHVVNTPMTNAREAYEKAWQRIDEQGIHDPEGRQSHTAWMVGDVMHVVDVWDSEEHLDAWMQTLGPILQEVGMELAGAPETGEVLQVVVPR